MRKFIVAFVLLLGVVFLLWRFSEVQAIIDTLKNGDIRFMFLALLAVFAWIANGALSFKYIYAALGLKEHFIHLLPVSSASLFLNIIAPSAGVSGMAVFIAEAHRRGYSKGRAALAGALNILFEYAAFICVLAVGLIVLVRRDNLKTGELIATGILVLIASVLTFLVYLGTKSGAALGRALAWGSRLANRVLRPMIHREYLSEARAQEFAHEAAEGLREAKKDRSRLILPLVFALTKQIILITIFWLSFLSFKVPIPPGTLIAGFSLGYLTLIISPTPAGIGIVEGVLAVTLSSMWVPFESATIVTLAYRAFTFWIPLLIGMFSFRSLGGSRSIQDDAVQPDEVNGQADSCQSTQGRV